MLGARRGFLLLSVVGTMGMAQAQGASSGSVDAMVRARSAAFAGCGTAPTLDAPLSLAALDPLNGYTLDAALKRQKFRSHNLSSLNMTYNGDVAWVKAQIRH